MPSVELAEVVILCLKLSSDVFSPTGGWAQKKVRVSTTPNQAHTDAVGLGGFLKPVSHVSLEV